MILGVKPPPPGILADPPIHPPTHSPTSAPRCAGLTCRVLKLYSGSINSDRTTRTSFYEHRLVGVTERLVRRARVWHCCERAGSVTSEAPLPWRTGQELE